MVIKKPNGTKLVCAGFSTGLYAALEQYDYPLSVSDDLIAILNSGRYFANLGLDRAYLQLDVLFSRRELMTINTYRVFSV